MAQPNQVSFNLTLEEEEEVKRHIARLQEILEPRLKTLSPEERHDLPKMGEKSVSFVQKAAEHCIQNPELVPPFLNVEEIISDVKAVELLRSIYYPMYHLTEGLSDTMTLSGSEAYTGGLIFYQATRNAAKNKIQNAQAIYDDLSVRFPGRPKKTDEGPELESKGKV